MASDPHRRSARLVARYLDPRRVWDAAQDGELRAHLDECERCRGAYRRAVMGHRLVLGADPGLPSGFEQERMLAAVLDQVAPEPARLGLVSSARQRLSALLDQGLASMAAALLGAAAVAALLVLVWPPGPAPDSGVGGGEGAAGGFQTRGDGERRVLVGIGISGVTAAYTEYEVVASEGAHLGDYFRFSYSCERPDLHYLFLAGLQPERPVIPYAPLPPEETQSLPIHAGRTISLPFEARLAARHVAGPLRVVAIFTSRPLLATDVEPALDPALATADPAEAEARFRTSLKLPDAAVVQLLDTRILPGSGEDVTSP